MSKLWTKEEDAILTKNWHRLTTKEIAEKLGKSEGSIHSRADKIITIETRKCRKWTDIDDEILLDFYGRIEIEELSKKLRRTTRAIRHRIVFLESTSRQDVISASLTIKNIAEIMGLHVDTIIKWKRKDGVPFNKLSNRFVIEDTVFWNWLKSNTDRVKFHKVKDDMLPLYPEWYRYLVCEKKKNYYDRNIKNREYYTTREISLVKHLMLKGETYRNIAKELNRTKKAIGYIALRIKNEMKEAR